MLKKCLPFILIFTLIVPISALEHVPGYGEICFPCHNLLLSKNEQYTKFTHCRCHSVDIWRGNKIEMGKLSELHDIDPCIRCHSGLYTGKIAVHVPHQEVSCSACHGEDVVVKPDTSNCFNCHKGGIHEIHGDILTDICVACHGEVINKFAELKEEVGVVIPEEKPEKAFSLYDFIRSILSFIFG
jgi:hypothetical protein